MILLQDVSTRRDANLTCSKIWISSFIFTIIDNFKVRYKMDYYSLKEHNLTIIEQHSSLFILNSLLQNELLKISHNTLFPPSYLKKGVKEGVAFQAIQNYWIPFILSSGWRDETRVTGKTVNRVKRARHL